MEKEFVTYEIALKLKELGFDEYCLGFYTTWKELLFYVNDKESYIRDKKQILCDAPLWQQTIDWLWKEHKILVFPYWVPDKTQTIMWVTQFIQVDYWSTKDQAILKALELCKNN